MPRYFFDIHDGDQFTPDYDGIELESIDAAKVEAKRTLPDIVKDEVGHEVLRVTPSLVVESHS
jgi:hypothetical protein